MYNSETPPADDEPAVDWKTFKVILCLAPVLFLLVAVLANSWSTVIGLLIVAPVMVTLSLRFEVGDDGRGIEAAAQRDVFMPFRQLDAPTDETERKGTGLGLTIAKGYVLAMGGDLTLASAPGEGAVFSFELAGSIPATDEDNPVAPPPVIDQVHAERGALQCVVCDDEPKILQVLAQTLAHAGHHTACFESAPAMLEHLQHVTPDLIILDVNLGATSGLDLLRQLRARRATMDVPICMLSGTVTHREACLAAGADDYLIKPSSVGDILATVDRLGQRRAVAR